MNYAQGSFWTGFPAQIRGQGRLSGRIEESGDSGKISRAGTIMLLGGMRCGRSGDRTPRSLSFRRSRSGCSSTTASEVMGIGTLFWKGDEPVIHLHGAIGRDRETVVGCIRKDSSAYTSLSRRSITEITGYQGAKGLNKKTGVAMLELMIALLCSVRLKRNCLNCAHERQRGTTAVGCKDDHRGNCRGRRSCSASEEWAR